jgi:hypothetical protein
MAMAETKYILMGGRNQYGDCGIQQKQGLESAYRYTEMLNSLSAH